MSRRAAVGAIVVVAWLAGLGALIRREYFRPQSEQLAEAAMRVNPGAVYYGVTQGDRQIGFASSTIDTTATAITVNDYLVAELPIGGKARRASARTSVTLSRVLRLKNFDLMLQTEGTPIHATGVVDGDSILVLNIAAGTDKPEARRIALSGPILLPTLVPLALALGERPKVGKRYVLPVFDPTSMTARNVALDVRAESLFVVNDSAVFDSAATRWRGVRADTTRAWQVTSETGAAFNGWIDEQGRIVQTQQLGLTLLRMPYEVAFENWRIQSGRGGHVTEDRDILETTAIASHVAMDRRVNILRLRVSNVELAGFALAGQRQRVAGDTVTIVREPDSALVAPYTLPAGGRQLDRANTSAEPLVQSNAREIVLLSARLRRGERNPRRAAERINQWVHDSLKKRVTFGVPNALQVLRARSGDCNEHTQLFVALARAAGIPTRVASGLAYVGGKFYYHAWPEILLADWVPVDPTFGQFPADAAHLRFVIGGLAQQADLLRLMGNLKIDVLDVRREGRGVRGE